jgi:hypothetical protein
MITESTITCPNCGHQATERMPQDACQFFYEPNRHSQLIQSELIADGGIGWANTNPLSG